MSASTAWRVPSPAEIPGLSYDALVEHLRLSKVNVGHYQSVASALQEELAKRSPTNAYRCTKCGHTEYQVGAIRTARSGWSSFFGVETAQYHAIICAHCKYTEFYQGKVPPGQQALDFLFGS
jgi:hypothetical protein